VGIVTKETHELTRAEGKGWVSITCSCGDFKKIGPADAVEAAAARHLPKPVADTVQESQQSQPVQSQPARRPRRATRADDSDPLSADEQALLNRIWNAAAVGTEMTSEELRDLQDRRRTNPAYVRWRFGVGLSAAIRGIDVRKLHSAYRVEVALFKSARKWVIDQLPGLPANDPIRLLAGQEADRFDLAPEEVSAPAELSAETVERVRAICDDVADAITWANRSWTRDDLFHTRITVLNSYRVVALMVCLTLPGVTQQDIAEILSVPPRSIGRWLGMSYQLVSTQPSVRRLAEEIAAKHNLTLIF
jgi:hypothetical protein